MVGCYFIQVLEVRSLLEAIAVRSSEGVFVQRGGQRVGVEAQTEGVEGDLPGWERRTGGRRNSGTVPVYLGYHMSDLRSGSGLTEVFHTSD